MKFSFLKRKVISSGIALLLVFAFICVPISQTLTTQRAQAISVVEVGPNLWTNIKTTVESTISAVSEVSIAGYTLTLFTKEFTLDTIAWGLVNIILQEMIQSVTRWVNSGFQGSPAFITDLQGFLVNIADRVAGDFIYGTSLGMLCSPFKLNIQLALDIQYNKSRSFKSKCTLSGIVSNMENFLNGDFIEGGWDGWYNMALVPGNNQYGAMLEAQAGLNASIRNAQGKEIKLLEFGRGFMTLKDSKGKTTTPGAVIETQLNHALGGGQRRLEVADEINELVGALFAQLARQAIGGLVGLTSSGGGSSGGGDYFSTMIAQETPRMNYGNESNTVNTTLKNTLTSETSYLGLQVQAVTLLTNASTYKNRVYGVTNTCDSGNLTPSLSQKLSAANYSVALSQVLVTSLNDWFTDYSLLENASTPTSTIDTLKVKYDVTHSVEAKSTIMNEFMHYQISGEFHTVADLVRLEQTTIPDLTTEISTFTNAIDRQCRNSNNNGG